MGQSTISMTPHHSSHTSDCVKTLLTIITWEDLKLCQIELVIQMCIPTGIQTEARPAITQSVA